MNVFSEEVEISEGKKKKSRNARRESRRNSKKKRKTTCGKINKQNEQGNTKIDVITS